MRDGKSSLKTFAVVLSVAIFCLLILAGCATKEAVKNVSDEVVLRDRATAYWSHRIKGELEKAYFYEDLYTRKVNSLTKYIQLNFNPFVEIVSMEILEIEKEKEDIANFKLRSRLKVKAPGSKPLEQDSMQSDQWVREDGSWNHISRPDKKLAR